jgi:SEC-C motif
MKNIFSDPNDWWEAYGNLNFRSEEGLQVLHDTFEKAIGLADDEFRETVIERFFELKDFLEKENRWDDYIALRDIIVKYQPAFFEKEICYIEPDITRYFLYHNDTLEADKSLKLIADFPFSDVDITLGIHGLAAAYSKTDWIIRFAEQHYTAFYERRSEYMGSLHLEIDLFAFFATAENLYTASKTTGVFDSAQLKERAKNFDLFPENCNKEISELMQDKNIYNKTFQVLYANEDTKHFALHLSFCKYMYDEKGVSFAASYLILDTLMRFESEAESYNFDTFDAADFKDYAGHLGGFMNNYEYKPILAPLGAIYMCDFLKKCNLISDKQHQSVVTSCINFVDFFAHQWHWRLKDNGYLRNWQKPDSMLQTAFDDLLATVAKAYEPKSEDTNRDNFAESLRINEVMESWNTPAQPKQQYITPSFTPIKSAPKIGRNDSCPCGSGKKYKKCCGK